MIKKFTREDREENKEDGDENKKTMRMVVISMRGGLL
jgi:hypothetical protein